MQGILYLVSLPIGHLGDITKRALETLENVDAIVAEDTRTTRRLLSHFGIQTPFFSSLYQGVETQRTERILAELSDGKTLALVSDAGTPLISDPGYPLVRAAVHAGVCIVPIPGPTAAISALVASGLPADRFLFEGSVPRKREGRAALFDRLDQEVRTVILYESSHRIERTLEEMAEHVPNRPMVVARELTKIHEEFVRGTAGEILASLRAREAFRGEFVLVVAGSERDSAATDEAPIQEMIERLLDEEVSGRGIVEILRLAFEMPRNDAYARVQDAKKVRGSKT